MPMIAAAVIGAGASMYAANKQASAQKQAASQQMAMQQQMLDLQKPYIEAGYPAVKELETMIGDYTESPLYKYRMKTGTQALQRAYAARGMTGSAASMVAEGDLASKISAEESDKMWQRTYSLAQLGSGQAQGTGGQQLTSQQVVGGYTAGAGQTLASGAMGAAGAIMGGAQSYNQNQQYNQMMELYKDMINKKNITPAITPTGSNVYNPNMPYDYNIPNVYM